MNSDKAAGVIDALPADAMVCNMPSGAKYLVLRKNEPPMVVFHDGTYLTYTPPWWRKIDQAVESPSIRQESEAE